MDLPHSMRAVVIDGGQGPASALRVAPHSLEAPGPTQVLIRVQAAGVNRPDLLQREGKYPPPPGASSIMGLEIAGEIVALGDAVRDWQIGDRVCALLSGGGYASHALAEASHLLPLPRGLTFIQGAALPETVYTVFANVFEAGQLKPHETFMVHGATSGIGVAAIQMAKAQGARVIATGRSAAKAEAALKIGADLAIDTSLREFSEVVLGEGGVDVILDMVGGDYVAKNLDCLNPGGRLVQIAFQAGSRVELDLLKVMLKRLTLTGSTLRARPVAEKARLTRAIREKIWPWIEAGQVSPLVDRAFPLEHAAKAHAYLEAGQVVGKVVLIP